MKADSDGMARLGLAPDSVIGARIAECGFDAYLRDDGLWATGPDGSYDEKSSPYNEYLKSEGYDGENPWHDYANSGIDEDGNIASGMIYGNARRPQHSRRRFGNTLADRQMIRFLNEYGRRERPWMCHLSYIKPHWPYIVPAPYHDMYGPNSFLPVLRQDNEMVDPNPVYAAFAGNIIGKAFHRDDVRQATLGAYMGLIKQIDDQMGVLFDHLRNGGEIESTSSSSRQTMAIILAITGWREDLFHEQSVKVPLIIHDPRLKPTQHGVPSAKLWSKALIWRLLLSKWRAAHKDEILEGRSLVPSSTALRQVNGGTM